LEKNFKQDGVGIAYIYFNYKEQDQTTINLIGSLLQQLIQQQVNVPDEIVALHKSHISKRARPSIDEYSRLLQSAIRRFSKVYIIVDALDECSENDGTRKNFLIEVRKLLLNIHLLATSRDTATIEPLFPEAARLEIRARDEDVKNYLKGRIEGQDQMTRHIKAYPALRDDILNTIVGKANGM
jgi:hypothetical protein